MPHNPFSVTFIFLESALLPRHPALLKLLQTSRSWSTMFYYNSTVYLIYSMCTSQEENKCLPSPTKQSDDQKKHGAQGELIRWTNTFLLDIFVGFIILHQVTAEKKKKKHSLVLNPVTSAFTDRAQWKNQSPCNHIFPIKYQSCESAIFPPPSTQLIVSKNPHENIISLKKKKKSHRNE